MPETSEDKLKEWRLLIEERREKGITVKALCKERNVTPAQFYYYQGIITRPHKQPLKVKNGRLKSETIKPVKIVNNITKETGIRFILPNSLQCVLPRDLSPHEIKIILELVMSC